MRELDLNTLRSDLQQHRTAYYAALNAIVREQAIEPYPIESDRLAADFGIANLYSAYKLSEAAFIDARDALRAIPTPKIEYAPFDPWQFAFGEE